MVTEVFATTKRGFFEMMDVERGGSRSRNDTVLFVEWKYLFKMRLLVESAMVDRGYTLGMSTGDQARGDAMNDDIGD